MNFEKHYIVMILLEEYIVDGSLAAGNHFGRFAFGGMQLIISSSTSPLKD